MSRIIDYCEFEFIQVNYDDFMLHLCIMQEIPITIRQLQKQREKAQSFQDL